MRGDKGRGGIAALRDTNADGRADIKLHIGDVHGSGMALQPPWLYFSSITSVLRYRLEPGSLALREALTHSSYASEHAVGSNERLEFLGDAVVDLAVADYIVINYPLLDEGAGGVLHGRVG